MQIRRAAASWSALAALMVLAAAAFSSSTASATDPDPCSAVDVDYAIARNTELRNTRMGAGDGVFPSGTGTLRLRFEGPPGPSRGVRLLSFDAHGAFEVVARAVFWVTRIVTDAHNTVHPGGTAGAARGTLRDGAITWSTKVAGYHSDGTLTCEGTMCGSFGAPPRGVSPFREGPTDVTFPPFVFSRDMRTFTMTSALVSSTPERSVFIALAGREIARSCVPPEPTPPPR
jgi:hypothetical protein